MSQRMQSTLWTGLAEGWGQNRGNTGRAWWPNFHVRRGMWKFTKPSVRTLVTKYLKKFVAGSGADHSPS